MWNATEISDRKAETVKGLRRIAMLASVCGIALAATALPVGVDGSGFVVNSAFAAAGGNGNGGGNGKGRENAPGQQVTGSGGSAEADAESALSDSGEQDATSDELPIAEDAPANVRVIKEIAGLADDSELSEEEELEAIRNGWGTWRTADGPESIIAQ